jgi:putative glycoside hydrolase with GxGYxYP motif
VRLTSNAAMPVLASDYFNNLEVWASVLGGGQGQEVSGQVEGLSPGEDLGRVGINPAPTFGSAGAPKAYVSFTMSDGDNLQYDQHRMARLWGDPGRGSIPIGWTISPVLVQAAPSLAAYYLGTATPNDELIAGPSGAGYMLPSAWPGEQLSPFLTRTGELMQAMKLSVLEVLDSDLGSSMAFVNAGLQDTYVKALAPFGVKGILSGAGQAQSSWRNVSGVPVLQNLGLADSVDKTVNLVRNATARFLNVYIFAWRMTPSDLKQVVQQLGSGYEVVTPGRLLEMIASSF